MSTTPNTDKVKAMDFDRLNELVSDRIGALKIMALNLDKMNADEEATEMICRDLVMPAVYILAEFLQAVEVKEKKK